MPILFLFLIGCAKGSVFCLLARPIWVRRFIRTPVGSTVPRADIRPLSFGEDIHHCVGAQLARIEAETAIATILRRLPNLRLDDSRGEKTF